MARREWFEQEHSSVRHLYVQCAERRDANAVSYTEGDITTQSS